MVSTASWTKTTFCSQCTATLVPSTVWHGLCSTLTLCKTRSLVENHFTVTTCAPVNQDAPEWNSYRLSMSRMKSIQHFSTPWRDTCNFPTDSVGYQDYWRVSLTNMDLLVTPSTNESFLFSDFINVLGNYCSNCMGLTAYSDIFALHTDSPFSYSKGCEFNGTHGAVYDEDNFGVDGESNSAFRCTSSSASTTQFWFGKHDLNVLKKKISQGRPCSSLQKF